MKHNTLRLYKHYCEMAVNPKGNDTLERANVRETALKGKAELEERFRTVNKYRNDPEFAALLSKQEFKQDGKKSKG